MADSESDFIQGDFDSSGEQIDFDLESEDELEEDHPFEISENAEEEVEYSNKSGDFKWTSRPPAVCAASGCAVEKRFNIDLGTIQTPLDAFIHFIDMEIIDHIVKYTNAEGKAVEGEAFHEVDRETMMAWMGILINAGRMHAKSTTIEDFWSADSVYGVLYFRSIMSKQRFKEVMRYIRFDDSLSRRIPGQGRAIATTLGNTTDRLGLIRWVADKVRSNFIRCYEP